LLLCGEGEGEEGVLQGKKELAVEEVPARLTLEGKGRGGDTPSQLGWNFRRR